MNAIATGTLLGGRYAVERAIASGGMGEVWEATDEVLGRRVAVKVLRPWPGDDDGFLTRFRAEARHAAALAHPHIAMVYDYGEDDGTAYLVMELVPGASLSDVLAQAGPLPPQRVRTIVGQAALALAAAHDAGVVHRDVKPANILLAPDGTAKLTDFGIARAGTGSGVTVTGEVLGTPDYLSPEQALGQPATGASDLYALGVVAHELLTGARPFDMGTPVATALAQVTHEPPPLPASVPADLRGVVEACLRKDPADRPRDALVVAAALGMPAGRGEPVTARAVADPTPPTRRLAAAGAALPPGRRRPALLGWAAAIAALLLAGGLVGARMLASIADATPGTAPSPTASPAEPAAIRLPATGASSAGAGGAAAGASGRAPSPPAAGGEASTGPLAGADHAPAGDKPITDTAGGAGQRRGQTKAVPGSAQKRDEHKRTAPERDERTGKGKGD